MSGGVKVEEIEERSNEAVKVEVDKVEGKEREGSLSVSPEAVQMDPSESECRPGTWFGVKTPIVVPVIL